MSKRARRSFTPEQKADAVRLVDRVGNLNQVARDLDVQRPPPEAGFGPDSRPWDDVYVRDRDLDQDGTYDEPGVQVVRFQ